MSYKFGVWAWGFVLVVWLVSVAAALIMPDSAWSESLRKHDSVAAAVTAVLGVIWSWFLQLESRQS
ncbi:hypothetical protein ACMC5O_002371 [Sphingomonas sediminicola]|uniref:hypothetical protein n=1 Tax=Sphingomonas sediminicola TaxID=386874 RepID=UPI003CEC4636